MAYEQKPQTGNLFRNKKKTAGDKLPDYKGEALIDGKKFEVAAWINEGKNGKYMAMKFSEPRAAPQQQGMGEYGGEPTQRTPVAPLRPAPRPAEAPTQIEDQEIPF